MGRLTWLLFAVQEDFPILVDLGSPPKVGKGTCLHVKFVYKSQSPFSDLNSFHQFQFATHNQQSSIINLQVYLCRTQIPAVGTQPVYISDIITD